MVWLSLFFIFLVILLLRESVMSESHPFPSFHHHDNNLPFGKGYVISVTREKAKGAFDTIEALGFSPNFFQATVPRSDKFTSIPQMMDYCLQGEGFKIPTSNLSTEELGLICSHRLVLESIAKDPTIHDAGWAVVLESDARLNPRAVNPRGLIKSAMDTNSSYGFFYLGLCMGHCNVTSPLATVAYGCSGLCTHGYMLTKKRATTFFQELYCSSDDRTAKGPCGSRCKTHKCQTDQMFADHFKMRRNYLGENVSAGLVAPNIASPDNRFHEGLLFQPRPNKKVGTNLTATTLLEGVKDEDPLPCFGIEVTGRLGNLMFEYASLVGICVKRGFSPDSCASLSGNIADLTKKDLPLHEFVETFGIKKPFCPVNDKNRYREHAQTIYALQFDPKMFLQPLETIMAGYMQSYKYFHPHAEKHVKDVYRFPYYVSNASKTFIGQIRRQVTPEYGSKLACVSVRRGDKTRGNLGTFYNQWALSIDYYKAAIDAFHELFPKIAVVFFTGGGYDSWVKRIDQAWVEKNLMKAYQWGPTFLEPLEMNHLTSMSAMTQCEVLVVSSSSFSWWAAYLSTAATLIVAPKTLHDDFNSMDYYPPHWKLMSPNVTT